MKDRDLALLATTVALLAITLASRAEALKTACLLTSEETSSATIRINKREGFGHQGDLLYKGRRLAPFRIGQANGFGTVWWSIEENRRRAGAGGVNRVIFFRDLQLFNPLKPNPPAKSINRMMLVGLGADLYYSPYKENLDLLKAGEGAWRIGKGCRGVQLRRGM